MPKKLKVKDRPIFQKTSIVFRGHLQLQSWNKRCAKNDGDYYPSVVQYRLLWCISRPDNLPVPFWVILSAHAAIALGTLAGGWRIVKTMGHRITKLRPVHGFAAETAGAATILGASIAGIPVSTTHVISSAIMGVGATKRVSASTLGYRT